MIKIKLGFGC